MERTQRRAFFTQYQTAGGVAVQAVYQLQFTGIRPQLAQRFDDAPTQTRTTMHGQPAGFVQHQQMSIFIKDSGFQLALQVGRQQGRIARLRHPHRWQTQYVPLSQMVVRSRPSLIHPHFTAAQDFVDVGTRHAFHHPQEKVIQPLPRFRITYQPLPHHIFCHVYPVSALLICDSILL